MPPKLNEGKGSSQTRRYRSDLRRQQAELTRERIVTAAAELFAAEGYARTTLAKIAAAAGVSAETVQLYGPKAALMVAAVEYALEPRDPAEIRARVRELVDARKTTQPTTTGEQYQHAQNTHNTHDILLARHAHATRAP